MHASGGDDVQQLCEAGEEEFLEIMALVGMASKPLHVRRLQKALQEWVNNPGKTIYIIQENDLFLIDVLLYIKKKEKIINYIYRKERKKPGEEF